MPTLPNMGLITPVQGADRGTWDDKINAAFVLTDAHDHTSGKGVAVPVAGLDIDDDIPMGGFALENLGEARFFPITALASGSITLFVSDADDELYWRSSAGVNVQLTDGAGLNITLVGGIAGDYASVGAEVAFDDANDRYTFKQDAATGWARLASGEVRVYETGTSESVYVGLKAPAALALSYSITLPDAVPADTAMVQMTSSGDLVTQSTKAATKILSPYDYVEVGSAHTRSASVARWSLGASTNPLHCPLDFDAGDIVNTVTLYVNKASNASNTLRILLVTYTGSTGVVVASSFTDLSTNAPGATTIVITGLTTAVEVGKTYALQILQTSGAPSGVDLIFGADVGYTKSLV